MKLLLDEGTLFYRTTGRGPPLLCMHGGLGLDHTTFRPWLDALGDTVELIYYDHLGNGRSEYTGAPEDLTHELWVDTADRLRDHLGHDRVFLFGHSYGAFLALEYALRHRDRLHGLILSSVAPSMAHMDVAMANAERKSPDAEFFEYLVDVFSGPMETDAELAKTFRTLHRLYFHAYDPARHDAVVEDVAFSALGVNRSMFGEAATYDVEDRLGEIEVPTLVLSGDDDWTMPPEHAGARVAAGIPDAEHVVFEDCGHWPFVEKPDRFMTVVRDWLGERLP